MGSLNMLKLDQDSFTKLSKTKVCYEKNWDMEMQTLRVTRSAAFSFQISFFINNVFRDELLDWGAWNAMSSI